MRSGPHVEYVQRWVVLALTFAFAAVTVVAVAIGGAVGDVVGHRSAGEVLAVWCWFGVVAVVGWRGRHPAATAGLRALGPPTAVGATLLLVARGAAGHGLAPWIGAAGLLVLAFVAWRATAAVLGPRPPREAVPDEFQLP